MLGDSGLTYEEATSEPFKTLNVTPGVFGGVRFYLDAPVHTTRVGGHFVRSSGSIANRDFFGAIVRLDNEFDYPDSADFTTPDVLGSSILQFPELSEQVSGSLHLELGPGWYGLVFGSGRFGVVGFGGAIRNNLDFQNPSYFGYVSGFGWGSRSTLGGTRYFVAGTRVPEPSSELSMLLGVVICVVSLGWARSASMGRQPLS